MRLTLRLSPPPALRHPGAWALLATTASVEFVRGALFIVLLPAYLIGSRHLPASSVGLVVSAQYLADFVFKTVGGVFSDTRGPWPILAPTLILSSAAAIVLPRFGSVWLLMLLALVFGIGAATNWPAAVAGVTRLGGEGTEGTALSLVFVAWLGGGGLGPVLSSFLITRGYLAAFGLVGIVSLVAPAAALAALFGRFGPGPVMGQTAQHFSIASLWRRLVQVRLLLPALYLQALALGLLLPVATPFMVQVLGAPHSAFGLLLLSGGAVTVASLPLFGVLVDRFGYHWLLIGGLAGAGLCTFWIGAMHSVSGLTPRAALLGLSYGAILPAWNRLLVGAVPESLRATFMGLFMGVEGLGVATGPALGGLLWTRLGPRTPFVACGVIVCAMALYYLVVPPPLLEGKA